MTTGRFGAHPSSSLELIETFGVCRVSKRSQDFRWGEGDAFHPLVITYQFLEILQHERIRSYLRPTITGPSQQLSTNQMRGVDA